MVQSNAQCSLACNGTTQVSLDPDCTAEITPDMILQDEGDSCEDGIFVVEIQDHYGNTITFPAGPNGYPLIDGSLIGEEVVAKIIDTESGNSCWGDMIVEDKLGPRIEACEDVTTSCVDFSVFEGPEYTDCEGPVDAVLLSEEINPLDCDDDYIKEIERVYTAFDDHGNMAEQCTITYTLERIDTSLIECPLNYLKSDDEAISCDGKWWPGQEGIIFDTDTDDDGILDADADGFWDIDGDLYPDPWVDVDGDGEFDPGETETGVPTYNGIPLWPNPDFYCNIGVFYDDTELPEIGCIKKIMRRWEIREWWCGQEIVKVCIQIIEIKDKEAPTFTCPDLAQCIGYTSISTNVHGYQMESLYGMVDCAAEYYPEVPEIEDNCSDEFRVDYTYPGGSIQHYDGSEPLLLAMGLNEITLTVYDNCYNSSECTYTIDVVDDNAPTAICDQFTVVGITSTGEAKVYAETFDDGSHDDCKLKKMLVRRMDNDTCECHTPFYPDMSFLGEYNGNLYYVSDQESTWYHAQKLASAMGGHLLQIDDEDENQFVYDAVAAGPDCPYYFDLLDSNCDDIYNRHDGYYSTYFNWATGQPDPDADAGRFGQVGADGEWYNVHGEAETAKYVMEVTDPCTFSSAAIFCCGDIGDDDLMVVFRAVDYYGNYNDCMVNVEVQDKLAPVIDCPPNTTVECDTYWDAEHLAEDFDEPTVTDNCGYTVREEVIDELNQCNIGNVIRKFTATDDFGREDSCKQYITFFNYDPFDWDDIVWPADSTIYECQESADLGPDNTGYPDFLYEDQCDLIGSNYYDEIFYFNNVGGEACFKILRTWTVIDWCQLDQYGDPLTDSDVQVIKVHNEIDPTLTDDCEDLFACTYDAECAAGYIELTKSATDDCTLPENLAWEARVDLNCDGSFDGGLETTISGTGSVADISGEYPIGDHCVYWSFTDKCGNVETCVQLFTIYNCKLPTPYCLNGLAVDLMPIDEDNDGDIDMGMIELWATDFDAGSYHPCGYDVVLSFSTNEGETNATFDCSHVEPDVIVQIYATVIDENGDPVLLPDGSKLQSYCETVLDVQDNMNACPDDEEGTGGARYAIEGNVATELNEMMENVEVDLNGAAVNDMTDEEGHYAFPPMDEGNSYVVVPEKEDEYLNGVSTLDIVLIQRHILGIQDLGSPYKIIAADINNDEIVTAMDLVDVRRVILDIEDAFPNNTSWRFVDKGYQFIDENNPLGEAFDEDYAIAALNEDMLIDFVGLKVGDVNNNADYNALGTVDTRSKFVLNIKDQMIKAGNTVEIPVVAANEFELVGIQGTFKTDINALQIVNIEAGAMNVDASHLNVSEAHNGFTSLSWNDTQNVSVKQQEVLFTMTAIAYQDVMLSDVLSLNSEITNAEIYTADLSIQTPTIHYTDNNGNDSAYTFALYQNTPNPFNGNTEIQFSIPEGADVEFIITDITGKVVSRTNMFYTKGQHSIAFQQDELGSSAGVLYYTMKTNGFNATKKMVMLK